MKPLPIPPVKLSQEAKLYFKELIARAKETPAPLTNLTKWMGEL